MTIFARRDHLGAAAPAAVEHDAYAALWEWRQRIATLYAEIRRSDAPERAWRHWRATRDDLFATNAQSPIDMQRRAAFKGLPYFPYDPGLRCAVSLVPATEAESERLPAGADGTVRLVPFARTRGLEERLGGELTLYWISGYGGGVFAPFKDATNGSETYAGGRYVLDTIKGADLGHDGEGRTILDFNFAYNPSCAYSARWICPLAPPCNRLPAGVMAGERAPPTS